MIDEETIPVSEGAQRRYERGVEPPDENAKIVRIIKSIRVNEHIPAHLDKSVVSEKYFNTFNYSILSRDIQNIRMALGVTSPNPGEGKTLVASNFAVSLALTSRRKTIIVDLNVGNPRLHDIFGVPLHPGLAEALLDGTIRVSRTVFDDLYILPLGNFLLHREKGGGTLPHTEEGLGLEQLAMFRDVVYSLQQEFDFVIVDMPSIKTDTLPVQFANQLDGLVIVVDTSRTKREDIDSMLRQLNERQIVGFVLNRFGK